MINVLQMLEATTDQYPESTAVSDSEGSYSWKEFTDNAKAIGSCFRTYPNSHRPIAVLMKKSKELLNSFFGIVYSGNFYVPIDDEMPNDRINKIMSVLDPVAVITTEEYKEKVDALEGGFEVYDYHAIIHTPVDHAFLDEVRKNAIDTDPVYALFTSGSTGVPKGVVCCHRSVLHYADWIADSFPFSDKTILGSQTPFYFSMSVFDIYASIKCGAELHIIPKVLFTSPIKLLEHMNEKRIDSIYWVPTALCIVANLKALDKVDMPYLKNILFAGEPMPVKQLNEWRRHLPDALYANLFGPTEITDTGLYYVVDREFSDDESLPIGRKYNNVDVLVLNDQDEPVQGNEMGELCIRGSYLALGYYNNPTKTSEAFVQNPLNKAYPELIYRTGDLVSYNEYGELMYHGRKDFQIKHRGNRIELGEIEQAASVVPGINLCACIYDFNKEKIVLFYQGENVTPQSIREVMNSKVPSYMIPNVMQELEELPKNQNGKIDRKLLSENYKNNLYKKK